MDAASISTEKIEAVAKLANCPIEETEKILDPEFTYWSERGDCTREEHFDFLENCSVEEIAGWVRSIWHDIQSEQPPVL